MLLNRFGPVQGPRPQGRGGSCLSLRGVGRLGLFRSLQKLHEENKTGYCVGPPFLLKNLYLLVFNRG